MRQNKNTYDFTFVDQDWIGLVIFKNFADQDWIGINFIGSGLDLDWKFSQTLSSGLCQIMPMFRSRWLVFWVW